MNTGGDTNTPPKNSKTSPSASWTSITPTLGCAFPSKGPFTALMRVAAARATASAADTMSIFRMALSLRLGPTSDPRERARPRNPGFPYVSELPRELGPRAHVELAVVALQVRFDGVDAHEERVRDLAVRPPLGHEVRDLRLGGRESGRGRRPTPDPCQLASGPIGP